MPGERKSRPLILLPTVFNLQSLIDERKAEGAYLQEPQNYIDCFLKKIDKSKNEPKSVYTNTNFKKYFFKKCSEIEWAWVFLTSFRRKFTNDDWRLPANWVNYVGRDAKLRRAFPHPESTCSRKMSSWDWCRGCETFSHYVGRYWKVGQRIFTFYKDPCKFIRHNLCKYVNTKFFCYVNITWLHSAQFQIFSDDTFFTEFFGMPYFQATILETHRLGNIVPIPIPRVSPANWTLRGYTIPKVENFFMKIFQLYVCFIFGLSGHTHNFEPLFGPYGRRILGWPENLPTRTVH